MQAATKKEFGEICKREAARHRRYRNGYALLIVQARDEGKLLTGIKEELRETDTFLRQSDGSFLVLLVEPAPGAVERSGAARVASRLSEAFGACRVGYARSEDRRVAAGVLLTEAEGAFSRASMQGPEVPARAERKAVP